MWGARQALQGLGTRLFGPHQIVDPPRVRCAIAPAHQGPRGVPPGPSGRARTDGSLQRLRPTRSSVSATSREQLSGKALLRRWRFDRRIVVRRFDRRRVALRIGRSNRSRRWQVRDDDRRRGIVRRFRRAAAVSRFIRGASHRPKLRFVPPFVCLARLKCKYQVGT